VGSTDQNSQCQFFGSRERRLPYRRAHRDVVARRNVARRNVARQRRRDPSGRAEPEIAVVVVLGGVWWHRERRVLVLRLDV
jgi:hypothetical protein